MEKRESELEKFSMKIFITNDFQLLIESGDKGDRRTRIKKDGSLFVLTTNAWEFSRLSEKIDNLVKIARVGDDMTITEYIGENFVLRIVAEQE